MSQRGVTAVLWSLLVGALPGCRESLAGVYDQVSGATALLESSDVRLQLHPSGSVLLVHGGARSQSKDADAHEDVMRVLAPRSPVLGGLPLELEPVLKGSWEARDDGAVIRIGGLAVSCSLSSRFLDCSPGPTFVRVENFQPQSHEGFAPERVVPLEGAQRGRSLALSVGIDRERGRVLAQLRSLTGQRVVIAPSTLDVTFAREGWPMLSLRANQDVSCDALAVREGAEVAVVEYDSSAAIHPSLVRIQFGCGECEECTEAIEPESFAFSDALEP